MVQPRRQRARVFGEVAELYDRRRPAYPTSLLDDVLGFVPGARDVVEIGCGTGKATVALAARGLRVLAVEPDPDMARVARARTAGRRVTIRVARFEDSGLGSESTDLVAAGQSLHWVEPHRGLQLAHRVLRPGGGLAAFWNVSRPDDNPLRDELDEAYARHAPEIAGGAVLAGVGVEAARRTIEASALFGTPEERHYDWEQPYSGAAFAELVQTHSDHRMLPPARLAELVDAVATVIERHGDELRYPYRSVLLLARRIESAPASG